MEIEENEGLLKLKPPDQYYRYDDYCDPNKAIIKITDIKDRIDELRQELWNANCLCDRWKGVNHNLKYGIYFRGESKQHDHLLPSIGRKNSNGVRYNLDDERDLLHRFRRRSYDQLHRILTDWETIFLAQHHLLPTRLLDWTSNYLVALYWACEKDEHIKEDGTIWVMVRQPSEDFDLNVFDAPLLKYKQAQDFKFLVEGVKVIYPFYVSPRMTTQGGLFTIQDKPWTSLEEYPIKHPEMYKRKNFDIFHIRKWKVKSQCKNCILKELDEIGINIQSLYPDLDGLAEGLKRTHKMRQ
jgi:hypothetical protein